MPSGIASLPYRLRDSEPESRVRLLFRARRGSLRLDRRLATGARHAGNPRLASRARQLVEPAARERLAAQVDRILALADGNPRRLVGPAGAPFRPERVKSNGPLLSRIAEILRRPQEPAVRGVAMTSVLLRDNTSPLYANDSPDDLGEVLSGIVAVLEP